VFRSPGAVLLHAGPLTLRWYGVMVALAMGAGLWVAARAGGRRGLDRGEVLKAGEVALLGGLVGARLYYVLFSWDYYAAAPWKILAVWEGGTAIHGGLIGGVLAGAAYARWRRLPLARCLDAAAPALALGQAIGRWGDFFNEQAFGPPTSLPWGLYVSPAHRPLPYVQADFFHPAFLYESVWSLIVLGILLTSRRRLAGAPGALFLAYLGWYSLGRLWIEMIRVDALMLGPFRVAQLASAVGILLAVIGVPRMMKEAQPAPS
jgi:phosphatidylglycerol:prolipoprotein diacylglycerol transferase